MMKISALAAGVGAALALSMPALAQQPAQPFTTPVSLDRIVAVVGDQPITMYDLQERLLQRQQQLQQPLPTDSAQLHELQQQTLNEMIDEELLLQQAKELKIEVPDADINSTVDRQVKDIRARFTSEAEFRAELQKAGLGTPEEYRRLITDQLRRQQTQAKLMDKLKEDGKLVPANVTDEEVQEAYERNRAQIPRKPASVTFRQIVIAPKPTAAAREAARQKAESLLAELKHGANFELLAKRESMDQSTKDLGGDLGWQRRGFYVPEFDRWVWALPPGELSPVVESPFGFHIIRVDRVNPSEAKARHILIRPKLDSADVARARVEADSVAKLWAAGVPFDTLARKHHDYASKEETNLLTPFPRDSLPETYQRAFAGKKAGDIVTFEIPDPSRGVPKVVVAQLASVDPGGERTLNEMKEIVRSQLAQEGGIRRYLDELRKRTFVSVRLDHAPLATSSR
ncbi:MAG TPA: peptidylprolyl isomerase [Gemmatimonadaceae bacterium]|nr:peptidylprolyl isomerase [Gemmatimonadaceae bacterium]